MPARIEAAHRPGGTPPHACTALPPKNLSALHVAGYWSIGEAAERIDDAPLAGSPERDQRGAERRLARGGPRRACGVTKNYTSIIGGKYPLPAIAFDQRGNTAGKRDGELAEACGRRAPSPLKAPQSRRSRSNGGRLRLLAQPLSGTLGKLRAAQFSRPCWRPGTCATRDLEEVRQRLGEQRQTPNSGSESRTDVS